MLKIAETKFFVCPLTAITGRSWEIIRLVNETTDGDGKVLHLPFPGSYLQQPTWYREAVQIVRSERARQQRDEMDKARAKHGKR